MIACELGELPLSRCPENDPVPSACLELPESVRDEPLGNIGVGGSSALAWGDQSFPPPTNIGEVPKISICAVLTALIAPIQTGFEPKECLPESEWQ